MGDVFSASVRRAGSGAGFVCSGSGGWIGVRGPGSANSASVCVRGRPVSPLSFRVVPVPQGRSSFVVASLRDGLRPPLTDRPAPECHKTAGKPPKDGREVHVPIGPDQRCRAGTLSIRSQSPGPPR
ncbi:hypothetical protein E6W17_01355 [Streptomyces sp. A1547]|nr:hypothetical protein E6W17_01355 [Streptomyces sp. A1547]